MLYATPIWVIAFALVVGIAICGEIGFHVGARLKAHLSDGPFGGLQAAFFGLLALLLAFSFSLGLSRYDARRTQVRLEANSIGTTYLRTQLLDAKSSALVRGYLRRYVETRIAFASSTVDARARKDAVRQSDALQSAMWNLGVLQATRDPRSTVVPLFLESLNDTIDQSSESEGVFAAHIPDAVVLILGIVIGFASLLLGTSFGRTDHRASFAIVFFAITLALVVAMILDLDRPQRGFIQISLEPLESLRQTFVPER
jgi:hypothetical protein